MWETILNLQQSIQITIEKNTIIFLYQKYLKTSEALFYFLKIAFFGHCPKTVNKFHKKIFIGVLKTNIGIMKWIAFLQA